MGKVLVRDLLPGDVDHVAANLCAGERMTIRDQFGEVSAKDVVARAVLSSSMAGAAVPEGQDKPMCLFGVVPMSLLGGEGAPWFLATEEAFNHPGALVRGGRRYVKRMLAEFGTLSSRVDARHTGVIKWLRLMGFTVYPPEAAGRVAFCRYEIRA